MENLVCYKQLPIWTAETIPAGFLKAHNTKAGTWAKLHILQGEIHFAMLNESGQILSEHQFTAELQAPFIAPQAWHKIISASTDVQCQLSFYCSRDDYFSKKYQLTPTHSEVLAAMPELKSGKALDVGCGTGRNSLYLAQHGFEVDAWDVNALSIQKLNDIIQTEQMGQIHTQTRDLNLDAHIDGCYDFICCTVVMMFLERQTIPHLIKNMQQATQKDGFNLIVCAMDTADYPVQPDFPFSFKHNELNEYYLGWKILKYNENVGELHRTDAQGKRIKQRFATLLAQKL